jgi:hypothetical protein
MMFHRTLEPICSRPSYGCEAETWDMTPRSSRLTDSPASSTSARTQSKTEEIWLHETDSTPMPTGRLSACFTKLGG